MTRTYQPVASCGESRKSGFEWEGWEVIPSSTPTKLEGRVQSLSFPETPGWALSETTHPCRAQERHDKVGALGHERVVYPICFNAIYLSIP